MALTIDELNIQIAADSSKASRALTSLINKLDKLKTGLSGTNVSNITITNSFNKVTNSTNKATNATNKYNNSTKQGSKNIRSFSDSLAYNITKFRTLFGVFRSLANVMGEWFKESNDYIETMNLFRVTMGEAADSASAYANKVSEAMGIDPAEWMQNQGVFKNLVSGFGVASDKANVMSQNLTQLSYDMASFFNTDVETAFDKLSSAMAGQVKGLREFGIDTTVASLQEYALAQGIDKKVRSMTQAEKSMLRYNYIMEKSIIMQGDMARTLITPANALRILSAQFTLLKRALGNIISVIAAKLIPYVQVMVEVITDAANKIAVFFGFDAKEYEADISGLDSTGLADGFEDAEDSLDSTSGKLKKLKKQLMGFDELNILSNPESDGGAGSDVSTGTLEIEPLNYDFLKGLDGNVAELKEKVKNALIEIRGVLDGFAIVIGTILAVTGANIPVGIALMALGALDLGIMIASNWSTLNTQVAETLAMIEGTIGGFLLGVGAILAFSGANVGLGIALMVAGAVSLATALAIDWTSTENPIRSTLATLEGLVGGAFLALGAMLAFSGANIPLGIAFLLAGAVSLASAAALNWDSTNTKVKGVIADITTAVGGAAFVLGALLTFTGVAIPLGIAFMLAGAIGIATGAVLNWDSTTDKVKAVVKTITSVVGGALLALGALLAFGGVNIPLGITLMAAGAVALATAIGLNWDTVKNKIKTVLAATLAIISGFGLVLGVLLCLGGAPFIPLGLALIFASIKGTQAAANLDDNPVTQFVKKMANGIIKIFNKVIEAINDMFHIKFDGLEIGGVEVIPKFNKKLVNLPKISYLAEGGFVGTGEMFIAREAGPELVGSIGRKTAVANNDQIISGIESGVYRAVMAANSTNGGGSQTIRIINEIDGDVVGEKVIQYHNGKVMQTGTSPLLV